MKVFCQVLAVNPYTLVVSLPNQLLGHLPITQVSTQFTSLLEAADGSSDEDDEESPSSDIPDLRDMFEVGIHLQFFFRYMILISCSDCCCHPVEQQAAST